MLRSDADVIVCAEAIHNVSIWLIRLLHRRAGKNLVLIGFFWRPGRVGRRWSIKGAALGFLRRSASALIAYTERGRQELLAQGVESARIFVSHNTLDTQRLTELAAKVDGNRRLEVRTATGTMNARPLLLFLGRLLAEKRPDVAIDALRILVDRGLEAALWVIGDGPERPRLERLAQDLPVTFLGSEYDEIKLAGYLASADLLVVPGRVGLSCVHGFASGLPCLTTDPAFVAQSPEVDYVVDGVNGYLLKGLNPVEYADRIERLWEGGDYERLRRGATKAAGELSMDRMVAAFASAATFAVSHSGSETTRDRHVSGL